MAVSAAAISPPVQISAVARVRPRASSAASRAAARPGWPGSIRSGTPGRRRCSSEDHRRGQAAGEDVFQHTAEAGLGRPSRSARSSRCPARGTAGRRGPVRSRCIGRQRGQRQQLSGTLVDHHPAGVGLDLGDRQPPHRPEPGQVEAARPAPGRPAAPAAPAAAPAPRPPGAGRNSADAAHAGDEYRRRHAVSQRVIGCSRVAACGSRAR